MVKMQIKTLEELESEFNQIAWSLDKIDSLSRILLDCIRNGDNLKNTDIENLTSVLNERVSVLKEKFDLIAYKLML